MTPEEHYAAAEHFAARAEGTHGSASENAIKYAILSVAHALMAQKKDPPTFIHKMDDPAHVVPRL